MIRIKLANFSVALYACRCAVL